MTDIKPGDAFTIAGVHKRYPLRVRLIRWWRGDKPELAVFKVVR